MKTRKCFSCGGTVPDAEGPVHRYMASSPGCWAVYGEVLAREYANPEYFAVHGLTVDAYAVQHPGAKDRQSIQSVGVHLIRLGLVFDHGLSADKASVGMREAAKNKHHFTWLEPPESLGAVTVADVASASTPEEHRAWVETWARSAWDAWSAHHETVRSWTRLGG